MGCITLHCCRGLEFFIIEKKYPHGQRMMTFIVLLYYILHKKLRYSEVLGFFVLILMIRDHNGTELKLDWREIFKFVFLNQIF